MSSLVSGGWGRKGKLQVSGGKLRGEAWSRTTSSTLSTETLNRSSAKDLAASRKPKVRDSAFLLTHLELPRMPQLLLVSVRL